MKASARVIRSAFAAAALAAASAPPAIAAGPVPLLINHTGRLNDGQDEPVKGTFTLHVRLYAAEHHSAGEEPVWEEAYLREAVNGVYSVLLGEAGSKPLTLAEVEAGAWMAVEVNSDGEMQPRLRVASVPYAIRAGDAATLDGRSFEDLENAFVTLQSGTPGAQAGSLAVSGSLAGASLSAAGSVNAASVAATGAVNAASVTASGAVNAGSFVTTGALNAGSIASSGTVSAGTLSSNGAISGASLAVTGDLTAGDVLAGDIGAASLTASGAVSGQVFNGSGAGLTSVPAASLTGNVNAATLDGNPASAFAAANHAHTTDGNALACASGMGLVGFDANGHTVCAPVLPAGLPDTDGDGTADILDPDADGDGIPNAFDDRPLFNSAAGTLAVRDGATSGADLRYQYATLPSGSLKANWDAKSGATKYLVWIGTTPGGANTLPQTDAGSGTSFTSAQVALQGAWTAAKYYVSVAAISATGAVLGYGTSNGIQIAEAAGWNGALDSTTLATLRNTTSAPAAGYFSGFPPGSPDTPFYGAHYFETVNIPAGTVVRVSPFGKLDSVPPGVSPSDAAVLNPKDGWLALYANTIRVDGTIEAIGRGYGGGGGAPGCVHQTQNGPGTGGANGLSGSGGRAGHNNCGDGGAAGTGREAGGGAGACYVGGAGTYSAGGGAANSAGGAGSTTQGGSGGSATAAGAGGAGADQAGGSASGGGGGGGGYGAGGGGGGSGCGSGGGGGGTGGATSTGPTLDGPFGNSNETGQASTGGAGAGPFGGTAATNGDGGNRGGYDAPGANADTTADRSFRLGSGGSGGGAQSCHGAGGGGAGGGAILLTAEGLTLGATGKLKADGAPGGGGAGECWKAGGGAGGAGGAILLDARGTLTLESGYLVRSLGGANGATPSANNTGGAGGTVNQTANGGTIKVFHPSGGINGATPPASNGGKITVVPE